MLGHAQNKAVFTHYLISPMLINPSTAGFQDQYQLELHARAQWTGFPDAPKDFGALFNGPIGNSFGIGAGVFTGKAAQLSETSGVLNVAFRFNIKENIKLATGFSTEFRQQRIDRDITNGNFYQPGDNLIENGIDGRNSIDASLGIWSTFYERTYVGLTFANLVGTRLDNIAEESNASLFSYYAFQAGHRFDFFDLNFSLEPSLLIRNTQASPFQVDFNVMAGFLDDQLKAGLSYRTIGTLGVLLGAKLSNFQLYYSYDLSFQQFQTYNGGSHEVTIGFYINRKNRNNPYSSVN